MVPFVNLPALRGPLAGRLVGVVLAAILSSVLSSGCDRASAAPVTGGGAGEATEPSAGSTAGGVAHPSPAVGHGKAPVSTGNRNLDLLLDMQGAAAESAKAASRPASGPAKGSVATPNTNLSGGVMSEIRAAQSAKEGTNRELLGVTDGALSARPDGPEATPKREWSGHVQGGVMSTVGRGDGSGEAARGGALFEPEVMRVLRDTIDWMRQNRWEVLGMLLGVVGLYTLIKFYTRRPEN